MNKSQEIIEALDEAKAVSSEEVDRIMREIIPGGRLNSAQKAAIRQAGLKAAKKGRIAVDKALRAAASKRATDVSGTGKDVTK